MTTTAHTPGPWAFDPESGEIYFSDGDVEPMLAVVYAENTSAQQYRADGQLIASAPALLKALKLMVGKGAQDHDENGICLHCGRDNDGHTDEPCSDDCPGQIARAAIELAVGA